MKSTFYHLPEEKRDRIIKTCVEEFSEFGYEKSSTDRIIKTCGISKGGLYEYINSKEELFLFIVDYTYSELYTYLNRHIQTNEITIPPDILERFWLVAQIAIDFYLERTDIIRFITRTTKLYDDELSEKVQEIFMVRFLELFGDIDTESLKPNGEQALDLLRWLLYKTRNDFLSRIERNEDPAQVKREYLDQWRFYLSILREGIYKQNPQRN